MMDSDYTFDQFLLDLYLTKNNFRKIHGVAMKRRVHTKRGRNALKMRRLSRRLKRDRKYLRIKPLVAARGGRRLMFSVNEVVV